MMSLACITQIVYSSVGHTEVPRFTKIKPIHYNMDLLRYRGQWRQIAATSAFPAPNLDPSE